MGKINQQLREVQQKLKAPKGQENTFGHYRYRSCEDILEAVKPLLGEQGLTLVITDGIAQVGERIYISATAKVTNDDGESVENVAFAREPDEKRGMDASQITGTASSYARKYSLNGLFAIDDTKDADTDEYHRRTQSAQSQAIQCEHCGKPIKSEKRRDGGTMTPTEVARWTQREAHMTLCGECLKAWRQAKANNNQPNNN